MNSSNNIDFINSNSTNNEIDSDNEENTYVFRDFSLHPLNTAQQNTISALQDLETFDLLPTHCINEDGELEGFHATFNASLAATCLPINRTMFHGHSVFECISDERIYNSDMHRLSSDIEKTKLLMKGYLDSIASLSTKHMASFECMPDYSDDSGSSGRGDGGDPTAKNKYTDCKAWVPELPRSIGVYQAYLRGHYQRSHKLFIVVSGGLERCGNDYYNLVTDVAHASTCQEIIDCQETWWTRKANQRARARLAFLLALTLGLKVQSVFDTHDFNHQPIASALTDTIEFDLKNPRKGIVSMYSAAVDTTTIQNGIACRMHPSEGVWMFRGEQRSSSKSLSFGSIFGSYAHCGLFPTRSPCYTVGNGYPSTHIGYDSDSIIRHQSAPRRKQSACPLVYQHFDEKIKKNFENMGWNRDNNIVELVPIVVGMP